MRTFLDWLQDRTGYQDILHDALFERIPGGARWRYVWGSCLVFTFSLQLITGVFLWMAYSPSAQTAWESVYYIQNAMFLGNVVRGIHHYAAQAMVVLLAVHLLQVIIDGAYRAPREINYWLGLILMQIVLGLSLTGYLLPWDQKGYYATQVSTKIIGAAPLVGPPLQQLVQGGAQYGHHTLTRFFGMHAGVLPGLLIAFLALHLYVFRRHGVTVRDPDRAPTVTFWPDQVLRDGVVCLAVLGIVLLLAVFRGAELGAPANPSEAYSAARPEWYFLFLFRFLRFEAIEHFGLAFGAIYVPGAIMLVLVLMPFIAWFSGGHRFNVIFMSLVTVAVVGLTAMSIVEDGMDADHQAALAEAERDGVRVQELASLPDMIPAEGAVALLRADPFTQGPRLFAKHCASCHRFDGHDGRGRLIVQAQDDGTTKVVRPTASDLAGFASRDWWKAILTDFRNHFAPAAASGYDLENSEMAGWSDEHRDMLLKKENAEDLRALVEYFVAQSGHANPPPNPDLVARGSQILASGELSSGDTLATCTDCHAAIEGDFEQGTGNNGYPELVGYGSQAWLTAFIKNPATAQFYGDKNKMISFAEKMSERELNLLVRWMTGDYHPSRVEEYLSRKEELATRLKRESTSAR
jgi:ubiquinol-cytochrome c reductase cytochrome b subunit